MGEVSFNVLSVSKCTVRIFFNFNQLIFQYFSQMLYLQILLQGHIGINRAVDGDIVAIEVLPKEEWRKPSDVVLEDKADDQGDLLEEESELLPTVKPKDKSDDEITPTGKVVGIIRRKWRQYCGILKPSKFSGMILGF